MTKQEEQELWIQILKPLADLAARREFMASHPDIEQKINAKEKYFDK